MKTPHWNKISDNTPKTRKWPWEDAPSAEFDFLLGNANKLQDTLTQMRINNWRLIELKKDQ